MMTMTMMTNGLRLVFGPVMACGCTPLYAVLCGPIQARPGNSNGIPAFQTAAAHDDSPVESEEEEEEVCVWQHGGC